MKCQAVIEAMEQLAPKRLAESWDNPGLLVGSPAQDVHKIMVCLDVSEAVLEKAVEAGADMIISHHPLIFSGIKNVRTDLPLGHLLGGLISNGIAVYAAHTNLDIAKGGVNDVLCSRIGLTNMESFVETEDGESMGRIGFLPEAMTVEDFANQVTAGLNAEYVRFVKGGSRMVKKVAVCSGSGAEYISKAYYKGADAYVTGDVKYHEAQRAAQLGIHVIDAGHFATEFPVVEILAKKLDEIINSKKINAPIITDDFSKDFFQITLKTNIANQLKQARESN